VKQREARHGDPHYRSKCGPLIRSEQLIRSPRVASLASASSLCAEHVQQLKGESPCPT
jgi:hypothetical protein